jgi:hypothetical protein
VPPLPIKDAKSHHLCQTHKFEPRLQLAHWPQRSLQNAGLRDEEHSTQRIVLQLRSSYKSTTDRQSVLPPKPFRMRDIRTSKQAFFSVISSGAHDVL